MKNSTKQDTEEITTQKNQNKQTDKNKIATITTKQTNKTKPKRRKKAKATTTKQLKLNYYVLKNTQVFS